MREQCCLCGQPIIAGPADPVALRVPLSTGLENGVPLYCHASCLAKTEAEQPHPVIPTFHDLTRAQAAQALLAAIVESSDDAIVSKTLDGVITSWNDGARRLFGYTADEAIGQLVTILIPLERQEEEVVILSRLRRGERIDHFETVRRAKDGRLIDISLTVSPIRDGTGRVVGASKVARDISTRKETQRRLEEADLRKTEFLALLAHELRNPLGPIRHAVKILRAKTPTQDELAWATSIIERQAEHMTRLVEDLLDVSRISRGTIELRRERVDVASILKSAADASSTIIENARHQLKVSLPPEPLFVNGDPTRLTQVVANLLDNAAKYTDPGGRIKLTAAREGDAAVIRVQDNGVGIAPEHLARIFDMFTQADQSLDRAQGGLGVGLALVERLVKLHDGTVSAYSSGAGTGSEFTIRLPLAIDSHARPAPETEDTTDSPSPRSHCRVLVVDDNQDAAESLAMLLRMMGHQVRAVHDGQEALALAATFRPAIGILDIGLPKMNGYELAQRIKEQPWGKEIVLVALTGWGQEQHRRRSAEAGFKHHLTKPVELEVLERILADTERCLPAHS
jgi:PAS domain S-box-containing protein